MEYKDTLNLPKTDFPMKGNLPNREPEILKKWHENDIYKIFLKAGLGNNLNETKSVFKINGNKGLEYYQTAFVHPSYVKKCIYDSLNKDGTKTIEVSEKPNGAIELFNKMDNIAAHYITTESFTDMHNLLEDEYCSKLVVLTTDILSTKLNSLVCFPPFVLIS